MKSLLLLKKQYMKPNKLQNSFNNAQNDFRKLWSVSEINSKASVNPIIYLILCYLILSIRLTGLNKEPKLHPKTPPNNTLSKVWDLKIEQVSREKLKYKS